MKDENRKFNIEPLHTTADNLIGMEINTVGDVKNFYTGVSNLASQMVSDSAFLGGLDLAMRGNYLTLQSDGSYITPVSNILGVSPDSDRYSSLTTTFRNNNDVLGSIDTLGVYSGGDSSLGLSTNLNNLASGVASVLGYGQVMGQSDLIIKSSMPSTRLNATEILWRSDEVITSPFLYTPREVKLDDFLKEIPEIKNELRVVQKEAKEDFNKLNNIIEKIKEDSEEKDGKIVKQSLEIKELKVHIDVLKKEIEEIRDLRYIFPEEKEIIIGNLKYKNSLVFYNTKRLDLSPQLTRLCRLFMDKSQTSDSIVLDDTIISFISVKSLISRDNMEKLVSKLRQILKNENRHIEIERISNQGYIFVAKNIR